MWLRRTLARGPDAEGHPATDRPGAPRGGGASQAPFEAPNSDEITTDDMERLQICFVTAEMAPLAKVGGLGDVAAALPPALAALGHDVRVFMPRYGRIDLPESSYQEVPDLSQVSVDANGRIDRFSLLELEPDARGDGDHRVYLVDCPVLYGRDAIYTEDADEHLRFLLLCRAVFESCQRLRWSPHVIHCNDWQTALIPLLLRTNYSWDRLFGDTRTLLSIHNLGYQGIFPTSILPRLGWAGAPEHFHDGDVAAGVVNFLKTGIYYADTLSTVSPTYAEEIQTESYGMGLHAHLRRRRDDLVGILNGVDDREWNPSKDRLIPHRYSAKSLWRKTKNKMHLLEKLGLPADAEPPLVGMVSRLTVQKGMDLLERPLPRLLRDTDLRLAVVASGERHYEEFFIGLQRAFPEQVAFFNGFSNEMAHLVEAGSDMFLMPSLYEPCGLNQMYSLKYGSVPVVRRTGGLADTVTQYDPRTGEGTGFVFDHYTPDGVEWALGVAQRFFRDGKSWRTIQKNGMVLDFSWQQQAQRYADVYTGMVASRV